MICLMSTRPLQRKLVELRKSQQNDEQLAYLKRAVDAVGDVMGERYTKGNPKHVRNIKTVTARKSRVDP